MYSPDERENIRAEMNRDAVPTPEEVEQMQRRQLAELGCRECDEDDPDELKMVTRSTIGETEPYRDPFVVLCDEHLEEFRDE